MPEKNGASKKRDPTSKRVQTGARGSKGAKQRVRLQSITAPPLQVAAQRVRVQSPAAEQGLGVGGGAACDGPLRNPWPGARGFGAGAGRPHCPGHPAPVGKGGHCR